MHKFYCFLGVVIFGLYLVLDTQMIVGGRRMELRIDEYLLAALLLYIDVIQIFMSLSRSNRRQ